MGGAKWQDPAGGLKLDVTVIGADAAAEIFTVPAITRARALLDRRDTVLVDSATRPLFGPLTAGRVVDIAGHPMTIGGTYTLGTGFLGLGIVLADDANFFRVFPDRPRDTVNLGLVRLRPGANADDAARALRAALPTSVQVFTRPELVRREVEYWTTRTATGLIFGSGLIVSFIVGIMVLYQTLATQVTRQLPQFATLKAIGYTNFFLNAIVVTEAFLLMIVAFVPALGAAIGIYAVVRRQTLLPLALTAAEFATVFGLTMAMAMAAAFLSLSALRRADPADVF
jgi:putative ABC transport system permease protein